MNNKLKILQIHDYPPFEGGGIEVMISNLSSKFVSDGNEVIIATSRFKSETFNSANQTDFQNGVKAILVNNSEQLRSLIEWADVVNIHFTFSCRPASMSGLEICVELNKPCVFSFHTNIEHIPFSALGKMNKFEANAKLEKLKILVDNDNIVLHAPSYDVKKSLQKIGIKKDLTVIRNPVEMKSQSQPNIETKPTDLTYIGEVSFMKGVNYLIDAIRFATEQIPDIKLRIIGAGSDFEQMQLMVQFFELEQNIEFVGYVPNSQITGYLKASKVYVHPSLTETWSNAVAEALLLETPVICTNVGGLNELISDGEFANSVNSADPKLLANEIVKVLSSKSAYKQLKQKANRASKFIKANYVFDKLSREYISFFRDLCFDSVNIKYESNINQNNKTL